MVTHLFNQVGNLLHPFAIWFHYHELVLGSFAFLAHLSAAVQAADAACEPMAWNPLSKRQRRTVPCINTNSRKAENTAKPHSFGLMYAFL